MRIPIQLLGQSGCRMEFPNSTLYIDPYLSNSVQELDSEYLERLLPIHIVPDSVIDADWVLITHDHIDHCDPHTLPKIAKASPKAQFIGPSSVLDNLEKWGVDASRLHQARVDEWLPLGIGLRVIAIPAAHPEFALDSQGRDLFVGYLLEHGEKTIYHAGDTSLKQEIIDNIKQHGSVHVAFLPVNEQNFFRQQRGIIGNMSVREAFGFAEEIGAKEVVPVHWDMFAVNGATPKEIRAVYRRHQPKFDLMLCPTSINLSKIRVSVVIRTLNEVKYLEELLMAIEAQELPGAGYEVIVVDSGSSDGTLKIAERHSCRILHITREDFSFGRSLNVGCEAAEGDVLVIISGHCVPADEHWLQKLCQPLFDEQADYSFGRQLGGEQSNYSEKRIFAKYYPARGLNGQTDFFCNNANAAIPYTQWQRFRFDEDITGLEDMELARRLVQADGKVQYVPEASVYHYHNESWAQVQRRFEREAIALQQIMPQVHIGLRDVVRYVVTSVFKDWQSAFGEGVWRQFALEILRYRWHQYFGAYIGNNEHRRLSYADREKYFFPE